MLARRIIAVSPDKAFGREIATALKAAGGAVDLHPTVEELGKGEIQAALVVLHLEGDVATSAADVLQRLTGDAKVIAILPKSNLATIVDTMQASDRVGVMMVAEGLAGTELAAMATRILAGDIFGVEKLIMWGTYVHSQLVGDYQEKSLCIAQISEFAELMGVRRKYRESIEQCVDEMLMNALYDAPVDEQGQPVFSEIPTKTRISLRVEQKVVVQYACDGSQFVVSVRDAFGRLERATVLKYLYKCLHAEQQIDRKVGGAGLGLYLMANSATRVLFNVLPGTATEVQCTFDLQTPKLQLEELGFFNEKIDAGGRLAAGPSRRLPGTGHPVERRRTEQPAPRSNSAIVGVLALAIVAMLALIAIVAYPRLFGGKKLTQVTFTTTPRGATLEVEGHNSGSTTNGALVLDLEVGHAYPVVARLDGYAPKQQVVVPNAGGSTVSIALDALAPTVQLDSQPTGASVEIDGKVVGTTPLTLTSLAPNSAVMFVLKKNGYTDAIAKLDVPGPGKELRLVQPLTVSAELARVRITSEPPGAQVTQNGQLLAGVTTPAEILVEGGKPVRFVLTLPRKVPVAIDAFTPERGANNITKSAKLVDGVVVKFDSTVEGGKINIATAPHCQNLATPAECVLAKGTYAVDFTGSAGAKATHQLVVADKDRTEHFEFGFVDVPANKAIVLPGGAQVRHLALEAGPRTLTIAEDSGTHQVTVRVKAGTTVVAN